MVVCDCDEDCFCVCVCVSSLSAIDNTLELATPCADAASNDGGLEAPGGEVAVLAVDDFLVTLTIEAGAGGVSRIASSLTCEFTFVI